MANINGYKYTANCIILFTSFVFANGLTLLHQKYSNYEPLQRVDLRFGKILPLQNGNSVDKMSSYYTNLDLDNFDIGQRNSEKLRYTREANDKVNAKKIVSVHSTVLEGTKSYDYAYIHWLGKTNKTVIILTCQHIFNAPFSPTVNGQIWISNDYGTTFKKKDMDGSQINLFYRFRSNSLKLIFTDVNRKRLYITNDKLKSFTQVNVTIEPDNLLPHSTDEKYILMYSEKRRELQISEDSGLTWTVLARNVMNKFYWGTDSNSQSIVHLEVEGTTLEKSVYKSVFYNGTEAPSRLSEVGAFDVGSLTVSEDYIFVQKTTRNESVSSLMVSYQGQPFSRAYFPGDLTTSNFQILSLDDGQIFVAVHHGDQVNLYLSDKTGHKFVLSLENIYHVNRPNWFEIDFHEIKGMKWSFIANKFVNANKANSTVATYISFDKGGNWKKLQVDGDLKKKCPNPKDCHLELHIKQSSFNPSVLSHENAPGIVLAHGYLGSSEGRFQDQTLSVFVSTDGGWTWKKAPFTGFHRFNILDQGSVLTAAPSPRSFLKTILSTKLKYSCDEGNTWQEVQFYNKGLNVKGVVTEPGSFTLIQTLFGHEGNAYYGEYPWVVVKLNYTDVLSGKCNKDTDYITWNALDYNSEMSKSCILGQKLTFTRRKQDSKCINEDPIHKDTPKTCNCSDEDFECDFGYYEKGDHDCEKSKWYYEGYLPLDCVAGSKYESTKGYRKVPSDKCTNEPDKYKPQSATCPTVKPRLLELSTHSLNGNVVGRKIEFVIEQLGGSLMNTTYQWDFGDSKKESYKDYTKAKKQEHVYLSPGSYKVIVTAKNAKGTTKAELSLNVHNRIDNFVVSRPWAGQVGQSLQMDVVVPLGLSPHFVWNFGDEASGEHPLLTWNSSVRHTYTKPGVYKISVEVVNSVSSVFKEMSITIFRTTKILVLTFEKDVVKKIGLFSGFVGSIFKQRAQQQFCEDLGVRKDRLEISFLEGPTADCHLNIMPTDRPEALTMQQIQDKVIQLVNKKQLGVNLYGRKMGPGDILMVLSAKPFTASKGYKGYNLKAAYIAAPVLIVVLVISVFLFVYFRRKMRNARHYSMLTSQDNSDALLGDDDDDEPPLDLNSDFGVQENSRDEALLDVGGSHLVMVTGGGGAESGENC